MEISAWYRDHFETRLSGRYIHSKHIEPLLDLYKDKFSISVIGTSESKKNIHCIKIGTGKKVVLAWSQMHGNESTTTKALFDLFRFITQKDVYQETIASFLKSYTFYCVPILNPDGAELYTRENTNNIDLNRDAKDLSQSESRVLLRLFREIKADLCLNLHDQRTLYSLPDNQCATISLLAPAVNEAGEITEARKIAMREIVHLYKVLSRYIPGKIGRYDDSFNDNCVGDRFQMEDVPTILIEAGHYPEDYQREKTREYIFYALLSFFDLLDGERPKAHTDYFLIPENDKNFKDVLIRNAKINGEEKSTSLSITYEEVLENDWVRFEPVIDDIGSLDTFIGHKEVDVHGAEILLNSYEKVFVGAKVLKIVDKNAVNSVFF